MLQLCVGTVVFEDNRKSCVANQVKSDTALLYDDDKVVEVPVVSLNVIYYLCTLK